MAAGYAQRGGYVPTLYARAHVANGGTSSAADATKLIAPLRQIVFQYSLSRHGNHNYINMLREIVWIMRPREMDYKMDR